MSRTRLETHRAMADNDNARGLEFVPITYSVFRDDTLSASAKLAHGRLKLYAGQDGRCYPSHQTLAREVCLSSRRLRDVLRELREAGLITWTRTRGSNHYTVFPERQKTASQTGGELHTRVAENCLSRPAENCRQKRSIENHHQKRGIEIKNLRRPRKHSEPTRKFVKEPQEPVLDASKSDDEKFKVPKPTLYGNPEDELKAIFRAKAGVEIAPDVERRFWHSVELRGVSRTACIAELRKHAGNVWQNPAGFVTSFARKNCLVATPEPPMPQQPEPPKNEHGRCSVCKGNGYRHFESDLGARIHCECRTGRDLRLAEASMARKRRAEAESAHAAGGGKMGRTT